jgi:predicted deacylase
MAATDAPSRIRCDIDFARDGRQSACLRAPLSRNTSGWGAVEIPVVVLKNGSGPTVLFTGGLHGDEYEGPIAISKLTRALDPAGWLHFVEDLDREPVEVRYRTDGVLWMAAGPGRVQRGDCIGVVMQDYDPAIADA